ncbi:MAG: aldo/keto reductase [Gemmatimonadetes bacterium]|jgi:predicted aldo/keto reductase-like oxidoreductase|nr:aldo/keto reductase [Gemmatimonadota bacterium]
MPATRTIRPPHVSTRTTLRLTPGEIPRRPFGRTGATVSALGMGGFHLGLAGSERESTALVHAAIDAGITFFDNAWEYHEGKSEVRLGKALAGGRRQQVFLMTKVCTHGRDAKTAMRQLEESLRRLKTDYLDLWQVHEVAYAGDPERHFMKGGVIEALDRAREKGLVRFVGFTGHKDPALHLQMLSYGYPFDSCQLPLNCFDATFRSFEQQVLPELARQSITAIGMKSMSGEGQPVKARVVKAAEALRYAMSLPVAVTVSGIDSMKVLRQNLKVARGFRPMGALEMDALRFRVAPHAMDGRFELYKTTAKHEADEGRKQRGYPPMSELGG